MSQLLEEGQGNGISIPVPQTEPSEGEARQLAVSSTHSVTGSFSGLLWETSPLLRAGVHQPCGLVRTEVSREFFIAEGQSEVQHGEHRCLKASAVGLILVVLACCIASSRFKVREQAKTDEHPQQLFGMIDVQQLGGRAGDGIRAAVDEIQDIAMHLLNQTEVNGANATATKASEPQDTFLLRRSEYVEQSGADIPVGGSVGLYFVGSSNVLWMTWIDQIHLYLKRLGYQVPVVPTVTRAQDYPDSVPTCDDTALFKGLRTSRFARIGWDSWDFAYDNNSDCDADGYRKIAGYNVACKHGMSCRSSKDPVRVSDIAEDASHSNVTVLSTFYNDNKQMWSHFRCFKGVELVKEQVAVIAIPSLLRTVRAIHAKNPNVWVLIMGKYPPVDNTNRGVCVPCLKWLNKLNERIKKAFVNEPRTFFVDLEFPPNDVEVYQKAHWGHTNCRGDKIMAHAVIDILYENKVLARGIKLQKPLAASSANANCDELSGPACQTSALCWLVPENRSCRSYSVGSNAAYSHAELL